MNWFYSFNNQPTGPVEDAELARLAQTGVITGATLVWHSGLTNWQPYDAVRPTLATAAAVSPLPASSAANVSALAVPGAATGTTACTQCGRVFPADEVVRVGNYDVCAECKPVLIQKLREGALDGRSLPGALPYAGFGIRLGAAFLDGIILIPLLIVFYVAYFFLLGNTLAQPVNSQDMGSIMAAQAKGLLFGFGLAFVQGAYSAFCISRWGATPGKRICDLRVVRGTGETVTFWRAYGRYGIKTLLRAIPILGIILDSAFIFSDAERRALHDQVCDTRVIYKR